MYMFKQNAFNCGAMHLDAVAIPYFSESQHSLPNTHQLKYNLVNGRIVFRIGFTQLCENPDESEQNKV